MARISPFAALRYNETLTRDAGKLCCPPYDIIPIDRQPILEAENPCNIIRLERPLGEDCYCRAGALLRAWREEGILDRDDAPAYYVYRMSFADGLVSRAVYGFFARVGLEPFEKGVILPHEETLSKDKSDRYALMSETFCNISPIYGLYEDPEGFPNDTLLSAMAADPDTSFTDGDGVTHSLWVVSEPGALSALTRALADTRIIIADGHHRYETALAFFADQKQKNADLPPDSPLGTVLMFLADMRHPDLVVWPTHRLVRGLPGFSADALAASLAEGFWQTTCPADAVAVSARLAETPHTVGFYAGGDRVTLFTLKDSGDVRRRLPGKSEAYCALEVTMLHTCILEPHLGIDKKKLAAQDHLIYTRDFAEACDKVRSGEFQCAFLLPPTPVPMIGRVAGHGERMPQKATYFYPKLTTGLVIHPIDE
ncbi:MAG: DUF1015 domain-containing protein [Oscillospiraceae bacterium]|nr:DUF1015 domain-containing protein [Oscillospiraceae bacterium]